MKIQREASARLRVLVTFAILTVAGAPASFAKSDGMGLNPSHYYDTDRDVWMVDTDGDGTVDLSEELGGMDPFDPSSSPQAEMEQEQVGQVVAKDGFATASCRTDFELVGQRLCIDEHEQEATNYSIASSKCRNKFAHVCTYEDLFYVYRNSGLDPSYNPIGSWIGNMVGDDQVLCGDAAISFNNDPDMWDFEGICNKTDSRQYWCCHDRD